MKNTRTISGVDALIFDLDGTLVDTLEDIASAMNAVLRRSSFPERALSEYQGWVGAGSKKMVPKASPEYADHELLYDEFCKQYEEMLLQKSRSFISVEEVLIPLKQQGFQLAVFSNKNHEATEKIIASLFPSGLFSIVKGLQADGKPKPDPSGFNMICDRLEISTNRAVMIGDTEIDLCTAANAGAKSVFVEWGYQDASEIDGQLIGELVQLPGDLLNLFES